MPVTATLSKKFYETFGEDVTKELVNWFNMVDTEYKRGLRELNERNFDRFDDRMGERIGELRADVDRRFAELRGEIDRRVAEVRGEVKAGLGELRGDLTAEIARAQSATVKWMFTFWAPTAVGIVGTAAGVVALLLRP